MERTYNFQVDNGLFVAEYYLKKDYKELTVQDLEENVGVLAEKLYEYNKLSKLAYSSHYNSSLTQGKKLKEAIEKQLKSLVENTGDDCVCMVCGENRVNNNVKIPYTALMYGVASDTAFMNNANNLMSIDICPICLYLSLVSFLNTQKVSYPFLYNTDSDEFMRYKTKEIQGNIERSILLDTKMADKDTEFKILKEIARAEKEFADMNYVELVYFSNGKINFYLEKSMSKHIIHRMRKLQSKNMLKELCELNLFEAFKEERHFIGYLIDNKKGSLKCTDEFYQTMKEMNLMEKELEIVERITENLISVENVKVITQDLKNATTKQKFKEFIIKYGEKTEMYKDMREFVELESKFYVYRDYILANIILKTKEENDNE